MLTVNHFRHTEANIRKAYFRMAQKYHPDKNPEGRVSSNNSNKSFQICRITDSNLGYKIMQICHEKYRLNASGLALPQMKFEWSTCYKFRIKPS